jgi:hypothetical protein
MGLGNGNSTIQKEELMIGKLKEIDRCFEAAIKNYECLNHEASRNCCIEGRRLIAALLDENSLEKTNIFFETLKALRDLQKEVEFSRDGFVDGQPYVITYSYIIERLNEICTALERP